MESWVRGTETLGKRITFGQQDQEEIYYTDDVSHEEAQQLGAFLQSEGVFDGLRPKSVRVAKQGEQFVVGFALAWNSWEDTEVIDSFRELLPRLPRGAFHESPVEIHLCARQPDSQGRPMPTVLVIQADEGR